MKTIAFLIIFALSQVLSAQIPDELETIWKGKIITYDGREALTGDLEIEINEDKLNNELSFFINKFSDSNHENFATVPFILKGQGKGFKFNHLAPADTNFTTVNGEYDFSLNKYKEQTDYLFGTFKGGQNFGAMIVLFRKDEYEKLSSSQKLDKITADIIAEIVASVSMEEDKEVNFETDLTPSNNQDQNSTNSIQNKNTTLRMIDNLVKLDADKLFKFSDGYAVIRKGQAYALIDHTGKIVIPYNVYEFASGSDCRPGRFSYNVPVVGSFWDTYGFKNGLIVAQDKKTGKYGVLNTKLETVVPFVHERIDPCSSKNIIRADGKTYDKNGNVIPKIVTEFKVGNSPYKMEQYFAFEENPDGLYLVERSAISNEEMDKTYHYNGKFIGYADQLGNIKIPATYLRGNPFSEGLAAVSKYDEYGIEKWGFINTKGEVIIDFIFSKRPSIFSEGVSLVEPASKNEFDYAYIDKTGEPVIKIKRIRDCSYLPVQLKSRPYSSITLAIYLYESSYFYQGYSIWMKSCRNNRNEGGTVLLDMNGNEFHLKDMLNANGYSRPGVNLYSDIINHEFLASGEFNRGTAIANVKGEIIINSPYGGDETGSIYGLFDPISNLTLVSLKKKGKERFGYANRNGEIIITLADTNTW